MTRYAVEMTKAALAAIAAQAHYIAVQAQAPLNAQRWLERVWDAVDSLEQWPRRAALAEESAYVEYEVRQLVVGKNLLLFTIDDDRRKVAFARPRPERPRDKIVDCAFETAF